MSDLDQDFDEAWQDMQECLERINSLYRQTRGKRIENAKSMRSFYIVDEARSFQKARKDIEKTLQAGQTPTDEQIAEARRCEGRLFFELDQLAKLEKHESNLMVLRALGKLPKEQQS